MVMPVLVLDPGHPTTEGDRGVVNGSFVECEWAMHIALMTKDALRWIPIAVELTRHTQDPIGLRARGQLSTHKYQADLVISIHANANADPRVCGMMTFHRRGDGRAADVGERIAETYGNPGYYVKDDRVRPRSIKSTEAQKDQGWWTRAFNVLEYHEAPAVLIEAGFVTNAKDKAFLQSKSGQQVLVASIVRGVAHWLDAFPAKAVV